MSAGKILVTGASTGIGEATVRRLCEAGFQVVATARREDRLAKLAEETGCEYVAGDITSDEDVERVVAFANEGTPVTGLVNNAGGALGLDSIAEAKIEDWQTMYERNVLGALRMTRALLPMLRANGGDIVFVTSVAAHELYQGGAGYTAAKHGEYALARTLRMELVGEPVRVIEICPGMVKTEEFSLRRLGSVEAAEKVYQGVDEPLRAEDLAECIAWTLELPKHVNVDQMTVRPLAQVSSALIARNDKAPTALPTTSIA